MVRESVVLAGSASAVQNIFVSLKTVILAHAGIQFRRDATKLGPRVREGDVVVSCDDQGVVLQPNMKKRALALAGLASALTFAGLLTSCTTVKAEPTAPVVVAGGTAFAPPPAPREFRAAWVSTVANIDWPTKPNLNPAQQQAEAIAILDRAKALNLNAVVLQVRPSADAIYPSKLEPWSEYLTGAQGVAPQPLYDPLKFWVTQAHARGLQLHAWFNPYRARHSGAKSPVSATHIAKTNPAAVKSYGKFLWMDPGEESASKQTLDVVLDVVRRYDIDGVHIDDYFYPYPIEAPGVAGEAAALEGNGAPKARTRLPRPAVLAALPAIGRQARSRRVAPPERQPPDRGAVHRHPPRKELGAVRHQPVRPGQAGAAPGRHRRLQPVRQAVRGRRAVAGKRLARLPVAAAVLGDRAEAAGVRRAARLLGGAKPQGPPHLAGAVHQPRSARRPRTIRRKKSSRRSASRARALPPAATCISAWPR